MSGPFAGAQRAAGVIAVVRYRTRVAELPDGLRPVDTVDVPVGGGATSDDPPAPDRIVAGDVAAHACRHLAYLRQTDPLVADRAATAPGLRHLLAVFTPTVAGLLERKA